MKMDLYGIETLFADSGDTELLIGEITDYRAFIFWKKYLSQEELTRMSSYRFKQDATKFAARRYFVKMITAKFLKLDSKQIMFDYSKSGKPFLPGRIEKINWSHSKDLIAVTFSCKNEIGVDIEFIDPGEKQVNLWQKVVNRQIADKNPLIFYRYWTAREALAKLWGSGLQEEIFKLEFDCDNLGNLILRNNKTIKLIQKIVSNYLITIAINRD